MSRLLIALLTLAITLAVLSTRAAHLGIELEVSDAAGGQSAPLH